jgi:hypothetical protein
MLQCLAKKDKTSHADDPRWIHSPQSVLWLVFAAMSPNVAVAKKVVKPETIRFGNEKGDLGGHTSDPRTQRTQSRSLAPGTKERQPCC